MHLFLARHHCSNFVCGFVTISMEGSAARHSCSDAVWLLQPQRSLDSATETQAWQLPRRGEVRGYFVQTPDQRLQGRSCGTLSAIACHSRPSAEPSESSAACFAGRLQHYLISNSALSGHVPPQGHFPKNVGCLVCPAANTLCDSFTLDCTSRCHQRLPHHFASSRYVGFMPETWVASISWERSSLDLSCETGGVPIAKRCLSRTVS